MNESLRPWHASGLYYVINEGEGAVPEKPDSASETAAPAAANVDAIASQEPPAAKTAQPTTANVPHSSSPSTGWLQLENGPQKHCHVIWTYWELGGDMLGTPSAARRAFLQQLIQLMRLPRGSIGFWPVCVPEGEQLVPDVSRFWQGVTRHGALHVCSFGEQATALLQSEAAKKAQPGNITLHAFPAVTEMAAQNAVAFVPTLLSLMQAHAIQLP